MLLYMTWLQEYLLYFFRISAMFEGGMISYERCLNMLSIPQERTKGKVPVNWPIDGKIQIEGLSMRYRPDTPEVIKNFNL